MIHAKCGRTHRLDRNRGDLRESPAVLPMSLPIQGSKYFASISLILHKSTLFFFQACEPVGNPAASHSRGAVHSLAGFAIKHPARRPVTQGLVRPLLVVKAQPAADPPARLHHRAIGFDEHLLILQAPPQPLNEDVVQEPALAVHADPDAAAFQHLEKARAGELHALVGVHNSGTLPSTRAPKSPFTIHITHTRTNAPR